MKKISYLMAIYGILLQPLNAAMIISDENVIHSIILDDITSFTIPYVLNARLTNDTNGVIISENESSKSENLFETHTMFNENDNPYYLVITPNESSFELPSNIQLINNDHSLIIFPAIKKEKPNLKKRKHNPTEDKKESKKVKKESNCFNEIQPYPNCINNNTINLQIKFSYLNKILLESNDLSERHMAKAHLAEMYFKNEEPVSQEPNKLMYALIYSFVASNETYNKDAQKLAQDIYKKIINRKY
ncbi:MAG: hypothetical protein Q8L85_03545 [Alphaproteobacteria bacterium]|nr:hypothetical protein [Alphaproteobacteria bacterium]